MGGLIEGGESATMTFQQMEEKLEARRRLADPLITQFLALLEERKLNIGVANYDGHNVDVFRPPANLDLVRSELMRMIPSYIGQESWTPENIKKVLGDIRLKLDFSAEPDSEISQFVPVSEVLTEEELDKFVDQIVILQAQVAAEKRAELAQMPPGSQTPENTSQIPPTQELTPSFSDRLFSNMRKLWGNKKRADV